ncbi:DUF1304 domain-containing protein [Frigidibacter sp. RF13]|uniref:DUF1304 domain-containing protein n=1 Tax=Frigidibacter sp. RF13 TaxID=2997340 RepID=UPI00226FD934|nr:DUF1304 domain-containing protein [Frigidibacter sp. RF13]MCY1126036.1 DUF1304 domain-containing protein [Frigidibacter sp. RF13]
MPLVAQMLIAAIAALHLYILWLEMFAWESRGPKIFRSFPKGLFAPTKVMAANQGLYNGFLAAGLIWSLIATEAMARPLASFFLGCVFVAGLFGALTASRRILYVQALPAALALAALWLG